MSNVNPFFLLSLICSCPPSAAIDDIPEDDCVESFGQIQKIIVQRTKNAGVVNQIAIADAPVLAIWNALKIAVDSTKVQATPYIQSPSNEVGGKREYGGGNATLGGIPIVLGSSHSPFTGEFLNLKQDIVAVMKKLACEKNNLSIFLVNSKGQIGGLKDATVATQFKGIPARSFFVSDKKFGNFEEPDKNMISWNFEPEWSDLFHVVTPSDFSALDLS